MLIDESEFTSEVQRTDAEFAARTVPIHARPIQAIISIFRQYRVSGPIAHAGPKDVSFPVTPANLGDHVTRWYEESYGPKTHVDPSPGRFPFLIEGAVYACRIPLVLGSTLVVTAKGMKPNKAILNTLDHVVDLPAAVRSRMSGSVENEIQAVFATCIEVAKDVRAFSTPIISSARTDIIVSCDLVCGFNTNPSLSAWHALQFAEKVLKQYISAHREPPWVHDIAKLIEVATSLGYKMDPRLDVGLFGFGPSVRYEPDAITLERAVRINHEAWRVGYNVLKQAEA